MHISQRVDGDLADARRRDIARRTAEIASDRVASASYSHMAQLRRVDVAFVTAHPPNRRSLNIAVDVTLFLRPA